MIFDFGVMRSDCIITIPDWTIDNLPDKSITLREWAAHGSSDAWVFPPLRQDGGVSPIWRSPPTHRLTYVGAAHGDRSELMMGTASFILYVLGVIAGRQLQHADWHVTGRQSKRGVGMFVWEPEQVGRALDQAVRWFEGAPLKTRRSIIGALFLHNQIPSYAWDWERFAWQYTAIDSAWKVATETHLLPANGTKHHERFEAIRAAFGLTDDQGHFQSWVEARNDLLHEAAWGTSIPGHDPGVIVHSYLPMRAFATLALLAACGIQGRFLNADWHARSQQAFQL